MKRYKDYLNYFQDKAFGKSIIRFEDKLLLFTTLSITAIFAVSIVFNFFMGLKTLVISSLFGTLFFFCLYLFGRIVNIGNAYRWIVSLVSLIFTDVIWFLNYGSYGPIMQLFVVLYAFFILVFDKKHFKLISFLLFLNLIGLYLTESNFVEEIGVYPNAETRLLDNYIGLAISFFVIYSFTSMIKKNYIYEFERAKMSDLLKSAFVANMSHEIRTPLNAIVGFSSLMSDPDISVEDKKIFEEQVNRNSDYLLNLIEDIIDVSKIESNQLTVKIQDIDVVPVISQIVQSFQLSVLSGKNVLLKCSLDMPQIIVRVDKVRFEQILRNLLSNALKFTENGSIEVGCQRVDEFYTFSVKDTGIGIHADHHEAIFERFIKIDNSKQHLHRGTGIGLFLSKQLVEMFGGKIWLESEVGKGSTFYFTIPV
jgi:signal transduction histidine kinase